MAYGMKIWHIMQQRREKEIPRDTELAVNNSMERTQTHTHESINTGL